MEDGGYTHTGIGYQNPYREQKEKLKKMDMVIKYSNKLLTRIGEKMSKTV